jgi:nucleoside 2-deoxyribosyltransferase
MKIYVASSWRCESQPGVVQALRSAGLEVYDFRHPAPGNDSFHWSDIDPKYEAWSAPEYRRLLDHRLAMKGYALDFSAMEAAEACVLVLPCGRSAHLEAGYFVGAGKPLVILLNHKVEPELMYKMAYGIACNLSEVIECLAIYKLKRPALRDQMELLDALRQSPGAVLALRERLRQIRGEGFTPARDDETYQFNELAIAGVCYADTAIVQAEQLRAQGGVQPLPRFFIHNRWPWSRAWWKPRGLVRNLERACALLIAELDRVLRLLDKLGAAADAGAEEDK